MTISPVNYRNLSVNLLTGALPSAWAGAGSFPVLHSLDLSGNTLTGPYLLEVSQHFSVRQAVLEIFSQAQAACQKAGMARIALSR